MLHLYVGKENLPKDMYFVFNIDGIISMVPMTGTETQKLILEKVEQAEYYNDVMFKDRFGGCLYYTSLSTGSKALLALDYIKDKVLNFTECGENALRVLSYINDGHIFLENRSIALPWDVDYPIIYNGKEYSKVSILNDLEW